MVQLVGRQGAIKRGIYIEKWERGTLSWLLSIEGVTEMLRSKAEVREGGEAAASVHSQKPRELRAADATYTSSTAEKKLAEIGPCANAKTTFFNTRS
jgi:hypothetical protein